MPKYDALTTAGQSPRALSIMKYDEVCGHRASR